ncbi:hypothetical protein C8Q80DRAFT_115409 [Daedaleopsis nitida]|nr:hypothetical protein C8Q80DRAFT_115409 [Daedaleopsis nitida]
MLGNQTLPCPTQAGESTCSVPANELTATEPSLPPTTTMSSSSTPLLASAAPSFFSNLSHSTSGSSTLITTRFIPYIPPGDPHAGAPTIKVTAKEPPKHARDPDALPKRKSQDPLTRRNTKKRRVSPPQEAQTRASSAVSSPAPSGSSSYASPAPTHLSAIRLGRFTRDTRHASSASSARSSVGPPPGPPRKCWVDEDGKPGSGFLSSEAVVRGLMKGYKACEFSCLRIGLHVRSARGHPLSFHRHYHKLR